MAQLNSTNVYGSLAVTNDISEGGTLLSSKYAASGHTHSTSIAASSSSNQLTLEASTKYAITAGGTSYVFTTPPNTTYESKAAASGGTNLSLVTTGEKYTWNNKSNLSIGTTATTAAAGNHTHTLSLAEDSGTSSVALKASTKYKLTAGGSTYVFTTTPNTTYESKAAASSGTDLSLVTTGEKYTWNNKSNLTIGTTATTAAAGNHTHSYAGSASAGGAANSVAKSLTIKVKTGTTEGTNLYTFDGSTAKTLDIKEGSNISLTAASGSLTIANTYSYTHPSNDGDLHVPATGTTHDGNVLVAGNAAKTFSWKSLSDAGIAAKSHTHNYAGSSSAGGAATSADKINTDAGSASNPVYFLNGVPVACTYSLNKTVPEDAVFTDTNTKVTSALTTTNTDYPILLNNGTSATTNTVFMRSGVTVNGSSGRLTAVQINASSALASKENISDATLDAVKLINDTNIVNFTFKEDALHTPKIGFIADYTDSLLATPNHDTMDLYNCIGVLMKAVQQLSKEIEILKKSK